MICKNCEKKSKKSFCSDYCERIFKNFPFNCLKCNSKLGFGKNLIPNTQILKSIKYKILRQYPVAGYVVDGYCLETNTVYEVYEPFHYKNEKKINKDLERQKRIQEHLNCSFIIIEDYMFPEL